MYDVLAKGFYQCYEDWDDLFNAWRRIYHWEKLPTNEQFRRAILSRIEWYEKYNGVILPKQLGKIYQLALADLQHPNSPSLYLIIADEKAYHEHFSKLGN